MSKKMKTYSSDFKAKAIIELLSCDLTLNELASKHKVTPRTIQNWKKVFLTNANLAFNSETIVADYKEELSVKEKEINELHRQLGKRSSELEWASKKLKSLDYDIQKSLIGSELENISILRQCELTGFNRSNIYYTGVSDPYNKSALVRAIDDIYTEIPFYGYRKVHQQLLDDGYDVGANRVRKYMKELGLKVIYPTKQIKTTLANPEHKKYPYLLRGMDIKTSNLVWSTDITYSVPGVLHKQGCLKRTTSLSEIFIQRGGLYLYESVLGCASTRV
jgi:putative transposase